MTTKIYPGPTVLNGISSALNVVIAFFLITKIFRSWEKYGEVERQRERRSVGLPSKIDRNIEESDIREECAMPISHI